jgi:hypothetical protein
LNFELVFFWSIQKQKGHRMFVFHVTAGMWWMFVKVPADAPYTSTYTARSFLPQIRFSNG